MIYDMLRAYYFTLWHRERVASASKEYLGIFQALEIII